MAEETRKRQRGNQQPHMHGEESLKKPQAICGVRCSGRSVHSPTTRNDAREKRRKSLAPLEATTVGEQLREA